MRNEANFPGAGEAELRARKPCAAPAKVFAIISDEVQARFFGQRAVELYRLANAIAIFAVAGYAVFFLAAFALPETRGRVL